VTQTGFQLWQIYPMICTQESFIYFVDRDKEKISSSDVAPGY